RVAAVLQDLGRVHAEFGERAASRSLLDESLEIGLRLGNQPGIALSFFTLGLTHLRGGDLSSARANMEESLEIFRGLDDKFWINACLVHLGYIDCDEGEFAAARSRFVEMNETAPMAKFPWGATFTLEGFARLAAAQGQSARALRLGGATDALRRMFGVAIGLSGESAFERGLEPAWRALTKEEGAAAFEEGRTMTLEEALAFALEEPEAKPDHSSGTVLSARETEVLFLVAEGLTDIQVAERLYVSPRTVGHHLGSIYRKLGAQGRAAAVHKASEMGLI
ncbi:MAG: LuxR C-terminal-related transcriptional regulator, partial [Rubrobacteraceae bacterium]